MLAIFATLRVKPGKSDALEKLLKEMAGPTRAEPGTRLYVFGPGREPNTYLMMERYDDKDAMKAHFASPHFQEMSPKVFECLEGPPEVIRFNEID